MSTEANAPAKNQAPTMSGAQLQYSDEFAPSQTGDQ